MNHQLHAHAPSEGSGREGFSVIEVVVAMVVFSVVMLGLNGMTVSTMQALSYSERVSLATALAEDEMERVTALDYAELTVGTNLNRYSAAGDRTTVSATGVNAPYFNMTVAVTEDASVDTKAVTVSVVWTMSGEPKRVSMSSMVSP